MAMTLNKLILIMSAMITNALMAQGLETQLEKHVIHLAKLDRR